MKTLASLFKKNIREYGMLIALVMIMVFFQWKTGGILMKPINITNLVLQNSYIIIMALGMLIVIVAGWIDLSVGSVAAVIGAVAAVLMVRLDVNWVVTFMISLLAGALIGAFQGYWIAYAKIPAFIVTLAGMLVFRGLTLVILNGEAVGPFPVGFQKLSSGFIPDFFNYDGLHLTTIVIGGLLSIILIFMDIKNRKNQQKYGFDVTPFYFFIIKNIVITGAIMGLCFLMASYKGLPNVLVILVILIAFYGFITSKTTLGRRIYAMGGNEKAARLSGVNSPRLLFYTFVNMGVLSALAGMIVAARLNVATPKAGDGFELDVIAACYIGGASASGGIGKIIGAVVGAFLIGVMNNGMSILGIGIDWQQAIKGLVLLLAVYFDVYNKNKSI
ncbi:multiple monosaccharide ABC transporter permease [Pelolinea submarina]|uniref:Xylose transport system permease protein XylH n=1 Tax=Pelolinea submarina TaxID=913107 RepID=A0A347ZU71_9CHLR|nr:multiple monosaccharide ABC transporter permease [Pelolinea submarina]REG10566.1 multiple monosaccharide ABC transporter membrane protein [Pelolinea submarina]BBB48852.1 multiple sugar transport system permease protein [Pelolinea submarina]